MQQPLNLNEELCTLEEFSLIKRSNAGRAISTHRLVQVVIQDEMSSDKLRDMWDFVIRLCIGCFPSEVSYETLPQCAQYEDQVLLPLSNTPSVRSAKLALVLYRVGKYLVNGKIKKAK